MFELIIEADDAALAQGKEPKQRPMDVVEKVMVKLGHSEFVMFGEPTNPLVDQIFDIHRSLYRARDLQTGGIHGGVFMFRDTFIQVTIPAIFGQIQIDPLAMTDFSDNQKQWIRSRPDDYNSFSDQFIDIFDFAAGLVPMGDFKALQKVHVERFWLAAFQLQASASALCSGFDIRGAVQSALIGTELSIKAGLSAMGASEKENRSHGHNLKAAASTFHSVCPEFDLDRVLTTIELLPKYVDNRYSTSQPTRVETGHIVMGAQFIAAEVMRQQTQHSLREQTDPKFGRYYPSL